MLLLGQTAQPQTVLDQVTVTPLPGPASCFAGTAGQDATMFLREDQQRIDCDAFGGRTPCLARREFAADGANGKVVSLEAAIVLRPSVTADGQSVYFSEWGFNGCGMRTDSERNEGCFGRDAIGIDVHAVATTPAGDLVAFTILDPDNSFQPSNEISVRNASTLAVVEQYVVQVPGPGGLALQLESMDFTANGNYIVLDAFNPTTQLWGIYAVDRRSGQTRTVVAPVQGLRIRNPALAQTSDDFIVFDAHNTQTSANAVLAANLLTGSLSQVASTAILSYPGYNGNDSSIVFTDSDPATESRASMFVQAINSDRRTPRGDVARAQWLTDGGVGVIYRRGVFDSTPIAPAQCLIQYGEGVGQGPGPTGAAALMSIILLLLD